MRSPITLFLLACLSGTSTAEGVLRGGYTEYCTDFGWALQYKDGPKGVNKVEFSSSCAAPDSDRGSYSSYHETSMDLDDCLTNIKGELICRNGGMGMSTCNCHSRRYSSNWLDCVCGTDSQTGPRTKSTSIDLNEGLYINEAGIFACGDITGTKTDH